MEKERILLRWAFAGEEITVDTNDGEKTAVWVQDCYSLTI